MIYSVKCKCLFISVSKYLRPPLPLTYHDPLPITTTTTHAQPLGETVHISLNQLNYNFIRDIAPDCILWDLNNFSEIQFIA